MKSRVLGAVSAGLFSLGLAASASAALVSKLGGQAVYDTDLNITWLVDANFAKTSGLDADGNMTWADANAWAAGLTIGGFTDWRLPATAQPDPSCAAQSQGFGSGLGCIGSEMGHLFNIEGVSRVTPGIFSNIQQIQYWSSTPSTVPNFLDFPWTFDFEQGIQGQTLNDAFLPAWAVRSGDVSAVPVPAAVWLFGSGLLGLIGLAKRKKA